MAAAGMRFTHAYAQPLCTNTRLQLMTGLYNNRNWLAFGILDPRARTIGHWMGEAGYHSCMVGKWQLQSYDPPDFPGADKRRGIGMRPEAAGFDEFCVWHAAHTEDKGSRYADPVIYQNGSFRSGLEGRYGPDVFVEYIEDYLERRKASGQPFFVYYSMVLPHGPMVPTPRSSDWTDPALRHRANTRYFKDMVEYMDACVGRVLAKVDALGLSDRTLILFYSDNGTDWNITSQTTRGPVVGGKGRTTDAGTHVPLIVRWPGKVPPGVSDDLVDSTDFVPTLRDAAGKPLGAELQLDGVSFYPRLLGRVGQGREWVFCHFDPRPGWDKDQFTKLRFARDRRYKLYGDGRLFDVSRDALEESPMRTEEAAPALREIRQRLAAVLDRMPNPESAPRD
jgi:arylsulfatase A-like enzyme